MQLIYITYIIRHLYLQVSGNIAQHLKVMYLSRKPFHISEVSQCIILVSWLQSTVKILYTVLYISGSVLKFQLIRNTTTLMQTGTQSVSANFGRLNNDQRGLHSPVCTLKDPSIYPPPMQVFGFCRTSGKKQNNKRKKKKKNQVQEI